MTKMTPRQRALKRIWEAHFKVIVGLSCTASVDERRYAKTALRYLVRKAKEGR